MQFARRVCLARWVAGVGGFGDWGLKGGTGRALGAWMSFWVWWGFKQASIYLGLGVALIGQTRSGPRAQLYLYCKQAIHSESSCAESFPGWLFEVAWKKP